MGIPPFTARILRKSSRPIMQVQNLLSQIKLNLYESILLRYNITMFVA